MITIREGRGIKLYATGKDARIVRSVLRDIPGVKATRYNASCPADPRILEWVASQPGVELDAPARAWYKDVITREQERIEFLRQEDYDLQHPGAAKLFPFQRVGAAFIAKTGRCWLADDCGLGKTVQAITGVEMSQTHQRVLVVCLNSLKFWWKAEYQRWSKEQLPVVLFDSPTREQQLRSLPEECWAIVNHEQLRLEARSGYKGSRFADVVWDWLIIDESHKMLSNHRDQTYARNESGGRKRTRTLTYEAFKALKFKNAVAISATPIGNHVGELWPVLNLLWPQHYSSYWRFFEMYVDYSKDFYGSRTIFGVRNRRLLRRDLAPRLIRRSREKVYSQLLPKTYQTTPVPMTSQQEAYYTQMAEELYVELSNGDTLAAVNVISRFTRLRQILSTPATLGLKDTSGKLDALIDLLTAAPERAVVFTVYQETVKAVSRRLKAQGVSHKVIYGNMSSEEVEEARLSMIDQEVRVLVSTIDKGGTGLNLRQADVHQVYFVDRTFNPVRQTQAEDRVYGVGQTGKVHIHILHTPGTVDDVVAQSLEFKTAMAQEVLAKALVEELEHFLHR